jgi:hypothetical protein
LKVDNERFGLSSFRLDFGVLTGIMGLEFLVPLGVTEGITPGVVIDPLGETKGVNPVVVDTLGDTDV